MTKKRLGDKTHEDLFDLNDGQKLILENKEMFILLPNEPKSKTSLYSVPLKLSMYEGFQPVQKTSYSSQDKINNKLVEKLV